METCNKNSESSEFRNNHFPFTNILRFDKTDESATIEKLGAVSLNGDNKSIKPETGQKCENSNTGTVTVEALPSKPEGREGMMNIGIVTCVIDPGEFYMFPLKSWECACKDIDTKSASTEAGTEQVPSDIPKTTVESFNDLTKELFTHAEKFGEYSEVSEHYRPNELVAVKLETVELDGSNSFCWFRAVIVMDSEDKTGLKVSGRLLDVGGSFRTSVDRVIKLPESFCYLQPLVYKCSLFGVNPLTHKWTKTAVATFKALTEYQSCFFEVKRTTQQNGGVFEVDPYEVQVLVKLEGVYHDVAHSLADEGLAVKWNFTPSRPLVSTTLDGELWNLLAAENDKAGQCLHSQRVKVGRESVMTREVKRMKKLLGRLNPEYDEESSEEEVHSSASTFGDVLKNEKSNS